MKLSINSFYLLLLICLSFDLPCQNVSITNIIAENFTTSESDLLEIKFNETLPNLPFVVAWQDSAGRQYAQQYLTNDNKLIIPMAQQSGWSGKLLMVGMSIADEATIRSVSFSDHWNNFISMRGMTPGSVNFTSPYFFKNYSLRFICFCLVFILFALFFIINKRVYLSLLFGFLISWLVYDSRNIYNRWDIMNNLAQQDYEIYIFKDIDIFLKEAREIIGDKSWSKEPLSGVINSYCTYKLADLEYKSKRYDNPNEADFIITTKPKKREIVYQHNSYFLISQNSDK